MFESSCSILKDDKEGIRGRTKVERNRNSELKYLLMNTSAQIIIYDHDSKNSTHHLQSSLHRAAANAGAATGILGAMRCSPASGLVLAGLERAID